MKYLILTITLVSLFVNGCSSKKNVSTANLKPYWIKDQNGCKTWNPYPIPNETIMWTGKCVDGYIEGYGRLQWYEKGILISTSIGTHVRGRLEGKGKVIDRLATYTGEFKNGSLHGYGVRVAENGKKLVGKWQNGKFNKIKNFGKNLTLDNFLNSREYQEFYSRVEFNMNFSKSEKDLNFITVISKNPRKKIYLKATTTNFNIIKKIKTETRTKAHTTEEAAFLLFAGLMNGNFGNNKFQVKILHLTVKPKNGYLDKIKNIITSLNPKNKNSLLSYLQNTTEWHFTGRPNIVNRVYISSP